VKVFTCPSIYGRLQDKGIDWAIYGYNRDPMTRLDYTDTQHQDEGHFGHFHDFQARAAAGTLPAYTFLEPAWASSGNSQHPNYDVALGEQLIRDVYRALRDGPGWNDTLLLVTYDEHGGNYDHVPPPWGATPPGDGTVGEWGFDFTRYGVRIPALLISPRIAKGCVFRAGTGEIDHTSVLKTIALRWGLEPLTERDKAAPDLGDVLTLKTPRTDDPLKGVQLPAPSGSHPNSAEPSVIEKLHASKVAKLPLRNDQGSYDHHMPPDLSTSAAIGDYIHQRTAAWSQHLQRVGTRKLARAKGAIAIATTAGGTQVGPAVTAKAKAKPAKKAKPATKRKAKKRKK
jgi:phospholipase C